MVQRQIQHRQRLQSTVQHTGYHRRDLLHITQPATPQVQRRRLVLPFATAAAQFALLPRAGAQNLCNVSQGEESIVQAGHRAFHRAEGAAAGFVGFVAAGVLWRALAFNGGKDLVVYAAALHRAFRKEVHGAHVLAGERQLQQLAVVADIALLQGGDVEFVLGGFVRVAGVSEADHWWMRGGGVV